MDRAENGLRNSDHGPNSDHRPYRTIIVVRKSRNILVKKPRKWYDFNDFKVRLGLSVHSMLCNVRQCNIILQPIVLYFSPPGRSSSPLSATLCCTPMFVSVILFCSLLSFISLSCPFFPPGSSSSPLSATFCCTPMFVSVISFCSLFFSQNTVGSVPWLGQMDIVTLLPVHAAVTYSGLRLASHSCSTLSLSSLYSSSPPTLSSFPRLHQQQQTGSPSESRDSPK